MQQAPAQPSGATRSGRRTRARGDGRSGIEVALTSLAQPGVQFGDPTKAAALARRCNGYAAELMARWPTRFGALATLPMFDTGEAVAEVDYGFRRAKASGRLPVRELRRQVPRRSAFDPVLAALDRRAAVAFVHPALHPSSRGLTLPWPGFMMEYLFDTTRAVVNLVFGGAIARFRASASCSRMRAGWCRISLGGCRCRR